MRGAGSREGAAFTGIQARYRPPKHQGVSDNVLHNSYLRCPGDLVAAYRYPVRLAH